jgi:hypothetical protein
MPIGEMLDPGGTGKICQERKDWIFFFLVLLGMTQVNSRVKKLLNFACNGITNFCLLRWDWLIREWKFHFVVRVHRQVIRCEQSKHQRQGEIENVFK